MSAALKKICTTCGRQITWRKKWEKNWEAITYCSDSCRKHKIKPNSLDTAFESRILSLLHERKRTLGIKAVVTCEEAEVGVLEDLNLSSHPPKKVGDEAYVGAENGERVHGGEDGERGGKRGGEGEEKGGNDAKRTRERCRQAARRLAARGEILVMQEGKVVDPSFAKGVMELKLPS